MISQVRSGLLDSAAKSVLKIDRVFLSRSNGLSESLPFHLLKLCAADWPQGKKKFTDDEIRARVMERIALEIGHILKEGVVASPKDVDIGVIMGEGWPFFMCVITPYLDQKGISKKVTGTDFHPNGFLAIEK